MLQLLAGKDAGEREGAVRFKRHRPEQTLLYRLIEQYYPDFELQWASEGRGLPDYVRREFDEYLKCGRLEHGFLRVQCKSCHGEHLVAFSCKRRGFRPSCGAPRMRGKTGNKGGVSGHCAVICRRFRGARGEKRIKLTANGGGRDAIGRLFVLNSALVKDMPCTSDCALSWIIRAALNPRISTRRSTRTK